jgi:iron complex outermembrane receptor protein
LSINLDNWLFGEWLAPVRAGCPARPFSWPDATKNGDRGVYMRSRTSSRVQVRERFSGFGLLAALAPLCCIVPGAYAAEADSDTAAEGEGEKLQEVVVTGTLIRGAAPTGAELISVTPEDIKATGATSTDQLLSSIPQVGNFFNVQPQIASGTNGSLQINRPSIRPLPNPNSASGALSLVLVDGHRIVGAGVNQSAPDPDVLPISVIERVEIVPDGGSSIYGADAVGGVINFITKRHFSGVEVAAQYGHANDYNTTDAHLTLGRDWGSGSAYISYNFSYHDALLGSDRSFVRDLNWATGIPAGRQCNAPNVIIGTTNYAEPGLIPGSINACDPSRLATIYPREERTGVFTGVSQDFGSAIHFDLRAYFTNRVDTSNGGPAVGSVNITRANPYYSNITGTGATQNVQFSYGPLLGNKFGRQDTDLNEWGITPTLAIDLGPKWQLRTMLNYGRSHTSFNNPGINPNLQTQYAAGTSAASAIDPYNITSSNQQILANLVNFEQDGVGISELANARVILDGSLFTLPGGDVSVALGGEYINDIFKTRNSSTAADGSGGNPIGAEGELRYLSYGQNVKAAFGELQLPIVGAGNRVALISGLRLSASARYDNYSDFGHTFDPKFALNYEPIDWIDVRGNYGRSFNAPTPVDELGTLTNRLLAISPYIFPPVGVTPPVGSYGLLAFGGTTSNLQPQTAHTYSFGLDVRPPLVSGLTVSATYYHIDFVGSLGTPPFYNPALFYSLYGKYFTFNPSVAQIMALASQIPGGLVAAAQFLQPGGPLVTELVDARRTNLGNAHIAGLDYSTRYSHSTGFGSIDASVSGNYQLKNETSSVAGAAFSSTFENQGTRLNMATSLGANWANPFGTDSGNLRSQLTWNHTAGYAVTETSNVLQNHVGSFEIFNLFFNYQFNGVGLTKDLALSLNVGNLFDRNPPVYKFTTSTFGAAGGAGYANGFTLGRLIQAGFDKKF